MSVFDEAYGRCLGTCFDTLVDGLIVAADGTEASRERAEKEATSRFKLGCETCKRAKMIASQYGPIAQAKE